MKKKFLRAVLLASLSLFAANAVFTATPVYAADKSDANGPKLTKPVGKIMQDVQKAIQAKDWTTAIAKLNEAQALASTSDYDKYIIDTYLGISYYSAGDKANATTAFTAAAEITKDVPESEHLLAIQKALSLEFDSQHYAKVIELAGKLLKPDDKLQEGLIALIGVAYFNTNDYPNALTYGNKAVAIGSAEGKTPDRGSYQIVLNAQNRLKDIPGETKTLDVMAGLYGDPDDWGHVIDIALGTLPPGNKTNRAIAALFLARLRLIAGAETSADDYQFAGDLALDLNSPGDAIQALRAGMAKGKVNSPKANATLAKANTRAKGDEAALTAADAAAAKLPNAKGDVSVAEGYYGYGKFADAARVAARAIAKGGPQLNEALLLLGAAQVRQGDDASAAVTFAKVKGDASLERVAAIWTIYATRKYGKTAAPAAAPAGN